MKMLLLGLCLFVSSFGAILLAKDGIEPRQNIVILLGPPGSGKGTQAERLTKQLNIPHISTGDLFRANMSNNTELGVKARGYIDSGKLVPDSLVLDMLFQRIVKEDSSHGFLLDGFPRTLPQAEALDSFLSKSSAKLIVINLDVPDEQIIMRAEGRLTCKNCGNIYNRHFSPPSKEGVCDKCSGELVQRADDKAEVVQERLRVYHNQTKPLISFYEKKGILKSVDGTQSPDNVFKEILKIVQAK